MSQDNNAASRRTVLKSAAIAGGFGSLLGLSNSASAHPAWSSITIEEAYEEPISYEFWVDTSELEATEGSPWVTNYSTFSIAEGVLGLDEQEHGFSMPSSAAVYQLEFDKTGFDDYPSNVNFIVEDINYEESGTITVEGVGDFSMYIDGDEDDLDLIDYEDGDDGLVWWREEHDWLGTGATVRHRHGNYKSIWDADGKLTGFMSKVDPGTKRILDYDY